MRNTEKSGPIWLWVIAIAIWVSRITSLLWQRPLKAGLLVIPALAVGPAVADDDRAANPPRVAPISSKPGGQTYGRWAAEWWQWALGVPAATNPLLDATGEHCAQRQVDNVWFLAGTVGLDPVVRECTIPEGKALFFPLINNFLSPPWEIRRRSVLRSLFAHELHARSQSSCSPRSTASRSEGLIVSLLGSLGASRLSSTFSPTGDHAWFLGMSEMGSRGDVGGASDGVCFPFNIRNRRRYAV
jgi:hypothetical protein